MDVVKKTHNYMKEKNSEMKTEKIIEFLLQIFRAI